MRQIRRNNIDELSQFCRAEIFMRLCRAKAKFADIAAAVQSTNTESSSSLLLLAFLSPHGIRHSRISNNSPPESPIMPFPPPPADTIGTVTPLQASESLLTAMQIGTTLALKFVKACFNTQ